MIKKNQDIKNFKAPRGPIRIKMMLIFIAILVPLFISITYSQELNWPATHELLIDMKSVFQSHVD